MRFGLLGALAIVALAGGGGQVARAQVGQDFRIEFPPIMTMSPLKVNLQTGRFELDDNQFSIGPLKVDLRWSSGIDNSVRSGIYSHILSFPTSENGNNNVRPDHPANAIGYNLRGSLSVENIQTNAGPDPAIFIRIGDSELHFTRGGLLSINQAAIGWKLTQSGSDYVLTSLSGDVYTFVDHAAIQLVTGYSPKPKVLSSVAYADGHRTDYVYGSQAELRRVVSNKGYAIVFDYAPSTQTITACGFNLSVTFVDASTTCAAAPIKTSYVLSNISAAPQSGTRLRISSVTDVDGGVSSLTWLGASLLTCMTLPNSPTCRVQNTFGPQPGDASADLTAYDQVRKQVLPNGNTWTYSYNNGEAWADAGPRNPGELRYTWAWMTDPSGSLTTTRYVNGYIELVYTPAGTTTYTRDTNNTEFYYNGSPIASWETIDPCPKSVTMPEGNKITVVSDGNCRVWSSTASAKPGSGLADITSSVTYPQRYAYSNPTNCNAASTKLCDKPIYSVDARGNQTDYSHDPASGMMLSETGPAVSGIRPQTRYTYAQRYAWIKNSTGSYVQAAAPIWLPTLKSQCKSGAASGAGCADPADEIRTTYDYGPDSGPNNLLLRGVVDDAGGLALRTCYGYDWQGNKVSETRPAANLGSCP